MSYTPPAYNAVNFTWVGEPSYTPPSSTAVNFTWVPAVPEVTGTGSGSVSVVGAASGALIFTGDGVGGVVVTGSGVGQYGDVISGIGDGLVSVTGGGTGDTGATGDGAGAVAIVGSGAGGYGASGAASAVVTIVGSATAVHPRYELRGVVKVGDTLVNRRVRAYNRDSGELVGQADTVAGVFAIHAGFTEDEFYVTPIDLDPDAVDWKPPTANRVLSVLAEDTA